MPFKLSPSSLKLYQECPRCFWQQTYAKVKRPEGFFPSLPNGIDLVLKKHFDVHMAQETLPPELKSLEGKAKLFDDPKLLKIWRDNKKGLRMQDDHGNELFGAIDNLLVQGNELIVLDYKTRGFPVKVDTHERYVSQMNIYNLLLRSMGYKTADFAYLLFYHPKGVDSQGQIMFQTDLVQVPTLPQKGLELFREGLSVLKEHPPASSETCGFCTWRKRVAEYDDIQKK